MIRVKDTKVILYGTPAENFKEMCNLVIAFAENYGYDVGKVGCDLTNAVLTLSDAGYTTMV